MIQKYSWDELTGHLEYLEKELAACEEYFGYWVQPHVGKFKAGIICGAVTFKGRAYYEVGSVDLGEKVAHLSANEGPCKYKILQPATIEEMLTHICPKVRALGQVRQKLSIQ